MSQASEKKGEQNGKQQHIRYDEIENHLIKQLNSGDATLRNVSVLGLSAIFLWHRTDQIKHAVVDAASDSDSNVRSTAIRALGIIGLVDSDIVLPPLVKALADNNDKVRQSASDALVHIGEKAVGPLISAFGQDGVFDADGAGPEIAKVLGRFGAIAAAELMLALSSDNVRLRAGAALSFMNFEKITEEMVVDRLIDALNDDSGAVQVAAAFALGNSEDKGRPAIEPLLKAMDSDDEHLRVTATFALSSILLKVHE
jgi:HEAT repeat protein